jgi:hypothetical protein
MEWKVLINPSVAAEMEEAVLWYSLKSEKLASLLMSDLANRLNALEKNPFFTRRYKDIYCIPLKKFPYMIHFQMHEASGEIRILGLIHTSRDPGKAWK